MNPTLSLPAEIFPNSGAAEAAPGLDIKTLLAQALAHHRQQRLPEAEKLYRQALAIDGDRADAWQLLGLVAFEAGKHEAALELIGNAIAINSQVVVFHTNRAAVLRAAGRGDEALAALDDAIAVDGNSAEIHLKQGLLYAELKRFAQAEACFRNAIGLQDNLATAYLHLGIALNAQKRHEDALEALDKAVVLQPQAAHFHYERAAVLVALGEQDDAVAAYRQALRLKPNQAGAYLRIGNIYSEQERFHEAECEYREALALQPRYAGALCNLGYALFKTDRFDEAEAVYRQAIAEEPALCEAHVNLGNLLKECERYDEAIACYRRALSLRPDKMQILHNIGVFHSTQGRLHEAIQIFDQVLARDKRRAEQGHGKTEYAETRYMSSFARLLLGDLERGFDCYEYRLYGGKKGNLTRYPDEPRLADIGDVAGRTILLHAEQGLGDIILFSRYAAQLSAAGAKVVLQAPRHLHRLFSRLAGVDALYGMEETPPPFDAHCALMSLPHVFKTTLDTIPSQDAYLFAEDGARAHWRGRLGTEGFKIGIAWQGNPDAGPVEKGRSAPLAAFAPLAAIPGVRLISLQKNYGLDQLQSLPAGMRVETLGDDFDNGRDAFIDTAAVMANLDLVVTVDTSIGHLAGALGRPTWIAMQKFPYWVWMIDRVDSPWYPSVRLFRQSAPGQWSGPFGDIAREVSKLI